MFATDATGYLLALDLHFPQAFAPAELAAALQHASRWDAVCAVPVDTDGHLSTLPKLAHFTSGGAVDGHMGRRGGTHPHPLVALAHVAAAGWMRYRHGDGAHGSSGGGEDGRASEGGAGDNSEEEGGGWAGAVRVHSCPSGVVLYHRQVRHRVEPEPTNVFQRSPRSISGRRLSFAVLPAPTPVSLVALSAVARVSVALFTAPSRWRVAL